VTQSAGLQSDDMESQLLYFRSNPPSCLGGLAATAIDSVPLTFDGHGSPLNTYWHLACRCGASEFRAEMYSGINPGWSETEPVLVGPITLSCASCHVSTVIFDPKTDGYDPVATGQSYSIVGSEWSGAKKVTFACPKCSNEKLRYGTRFEYPDDLGSESFSGFRGREQDLFTWISLFFLCKECGFQGIATDCECA
jgi:hypothetical protein